MDSRITVPPQLNEKYIATEIDEGKRVVIQFSEPPYESHVLAKIDDLAKRHGRSLQIRFYDHHFVGFDCAVLRQIPNAVSLAIDCLQEVRNLDAIADLNALEELKVGIYELEDRDFLRFPNLIGLRSLSLDDTKTKALNLSHLRRFRNLSYLDISGHTKNIDALTELGALRELYLASIPKRVSLAFVNDIQSLTSLGIGLGGRSNIFEVNNPSLRELEIIRVQGLSELTNLGRFPLLEKLCIEDQIRISDLEFTDKNSRLRKLIINNCKSIESLNGIRHLTSLETFDLGKTSIDLNGLIEAGLPDSLKVFTYFPGSQREYDEGRQRLNELGYLEFPDDQSNNRCT